MPLSDGYGAVLGTISAYYRDPPDNYGKYYHCHLGVATPNGTYECAVDVDSKSSAVGVEWRTVPLQPQEIAVVTGLGAGFHPLPSNPTSGAIDYIRGDMFRWRAGCLAILWLLLGKSFSASKMWKKGEGIDALADLEPLVDVTKNNGLQVLVFGEPFTSGLGLHNIHQNQGDPLNSQWAAENGIWQDGCTILQQSATEWVAFLNKFSSQSYFTDDQGHPA